MNNERKQYTEQRRLQLAEYLKTLCYWLEDDRVIEWQMEPFLTFRTELVNKINEILQDPYIRRRKRKKWRKVCHSYLQYYSDLHVLRRKEEDEAVQTVRWNFTTTPRETQYFISRIFKDFLDKRNKNMDQRSDHENNKDVP